MGDDKTKTTPVATDQDPSGEEDAQSELEQIYLEIRHFLKLFLEGESLSEFLESLQREFFGTRR